MSATPRGTHRRRLVTCLGVVALSLGCAGSATASDTFYLGNDSAQATLEGTTNWTIGLNNVPQDMTPCVTAPFPGTNGQTYTFNPGDKGSLLLTRDPLDEQCPFAIHSQTFAISNPDLNGNGTWSPVDPLLGDASLTCSIAGNESPLVVARVDGLSCTIADAASAPAASFVSSAAPLRGNSAVALVQHFPGQSSEPGRVRGLHQVIFSNGNGKVLGISEATLVSGRTKAVRVKLPRKLRKQVAKRGSIEVHAALVRIDGKAGKGDRAKLVILADGSDLPF